MNCLSREKCTRRYITAAIMVLVILFCVAAFVKPVDAFTATINGPGNGSGEINDGVTPCTLNAGGQCILTWESGSVTLFATPDSTSVFAGWGPPCNTTGDCTLSATTTIDATFSLNYRVGDGHYMSPTYLTITAAYAVVNSGSTIWTKVGDTLIENVTLDRGLFIRLVGGTEGGIPVTGASTTLQGTLAASSGSVEINQFIVSELVVSGGSVDVLSLIIQ